jgi:hypothetical protein
MILGPKAEEKEGGRVGLGLRALIFFRLLDQDKATPNKAVS